MENKRYKTYNALIKVYQKKLQGIKTADIALIISKFILIFFMLGIFTSLFKYRSLPVIILCAVSVVLVVTSFIIHNLIITKQKYIKNMIEILNTEKDTLEHQFPDYGTGDEYVDENHRYSTDLNLFGNKSLFHYLNRTKTFIGKNTLADSLKERAGFDEIHKRQPAILELSKRIIFRINLTFTGIKSNDSKKNYDAIMQLSEQDVRFLEHPVIRFGLFSLPWLSGIIIVLCFFNAAFLSLLALMFVLQIIINLLTMKKTAMINRLAIQEHKVINCYGRILRHIEKSTFTDTYLNELQQTLQYNNKSASFYLKKLSSLLDIMQTKINYPVFFILNNLFLLEIITTYKLNALLKLYAKRFPIWLDVIGHYEMLAAFGNFLFNNYTYTFPCIEKHTFTLEGDDVGHPLIPADERITNSCVFTPEQKLMVITGPNMSGKSTFLRSVGINYVLAFAGAPVCASRLVVSYPLDLYTSIQIHDSLTDKISFFYAELLKLKKIISAVKGNESPVFFLIDEMLKGTNASDRTAGSIALINQILQSNSYGIIGTHDIELAMLEQNHAGRIENYHFDSIIDHDKIYFKYRLTKGICQSFNSLVLMRNIGIEI